MPQHCQRNVCMSPRLFLAKLRPRVDTLFTSNVQRTTEVCKTSSRMAVIQKSVVKKFSLELPFWLSRKIDHPVLLLLYETRRTSLPGCPLPSLKKTHPPHPEPNPYPCSYDSSTLTITAAPPIVSSESSALQVRLVNNLPLVHR